jgi:hypothetical protein
MNADTALRLLNQMGPDNTRCPLCGAINPKTITLRNFDDEDVLCHASCPQDVKDIFFHPVEPTVILPTTAEIRDALETIILLLKDKAGRNSP